MKNLTSFLIISLLFSSCSSVQILEVANETGDCGKASSSNGKYCFVYSDSIVTVKYNFWANEGCMAFSIYNKLDVPICVDLKKSAFISNGNKLDYWEDETTTESIALYRSYSFIPSYTKGIATFGSGESYSTQRREQRIVSIPPKSYTSIKKFKICPATYFVFPNTKKTTAIFSFQDSPVRFRNYLVISLSEDFKDEFYVDNSFYVWKVFEITKKKFQGDMVLYDNNQPDYEYPYSNNTSFYIKITSSQNYWRDVGNYGRNPDL